MAGTEVLIVAMLTLVGRAVLLDMERSMFLFDCYPVIRVIAGTN